MVPAFESPSRRRMAFLEQACGPVRVSMNASLQGPAPLIAVVSSHLGHDRILHRDVCRRLSRSVLDCRGRGGTLLIAKGSAIETFARRAAELFGVPWISVSVSSDRDSESAGICVEGLHGTRLSRDQVIIAVADRVDAVFVRRGGTIERCLAERLQVRDDASTRVSISGDRHCAAGSLITDGAIGWYLQPPPRGGSEAGVKAPRNDDSPLREPLPSTADWPDWAYADGEWLVHCTRASDVAWPGQTHRQYLDSLLLGDDRAAVGDAFAAVRRIVRGRRLIAAAAASAKTYRVVCFSAVSLANLVRRRCYRSHLHRWDYEPYGIAIQLRAAAAAGVKPVIYGDQIQRGELTPDDRYRFQARGRTHDWTQEREWRWLGDLDLNRFSPCDVRVFVPTAEQAETLAPLCPWSISVVPES